MVSIPRRQRDRPWSRLRRVLGTNTAERFVRTARSELLDRTLIWNEPQLRGLLVAYLEHYNDHRPHRGINQRSPDSIDQEPAEPVPIDRIRRQRILAGLINEFHPAA